MLGGNTIRELDRCQDGGTPELWFGSGGFLYLHLVCLVYYSYQKHIFCIIFNEVRTFKVYSVLEMVKFERKP